MIDPWYAFHQQKIVYILDSFPVLSQTFVLQEILELGRQKWAVQIFSLSKADMHKTGTGEWHEQIPVSCLSQQSRLSLLGAAIRCCVKAPMRFLSTAVLTLLHHPWRTALSYLCYGAFIAEQIEHLQIYHLHAHFACGGASVAQVVHRLTHIPYSFMTHAYDIYLAREADLAYKMRDAHFVATCSVYNQSYLQAMVEQAGRGRIHCVYCGLNLALFPAMVDAPDDAAGRPLILSVGRLLEKKGLLYLVLACRELKEQGYKFICRIVGDGPQQSLLEQTIQELGLANTVKLTGAATHEQVIKMYGQATIVALPCIVGRDGDRDGIPNVLMEALYMRKAAVSTTVSGIPELITNEVNGLLVPPRDSVALATALSRLLDDAVLRHRLGEAGRTTIVERFNIVQNAQELAALFCKDNRARILV